MFVQLAINGLLAGGLYAALASGFWLQRQTGQFFDFSYTATGLLGAYVTFATLVMFSTVPSWVEPHFWLALVVGILAAGFWSVFLNLVLYEPLRRRGASPLALLLTSLGVMIVIENVVAMIAGEKTRIITPSHQFQSYALSIPAIGTVFAPKLNVGVFFLAVILLVILLTYLKVSIYGKQVRAVAEDMELAAIHGINPLKVAAFAYFISGSLIGFGTVCLGLDVDLTPHLSSRILYVVTASLALSALHPVYGPVLGGFALGFLDNWSVALFDGRYQEAIVMFSLVVALIAMHHRKSPSLLDS